MPDAFENVTANDGDTLCGIAARYGYPDCTRLRALAANNEYQNRPIQGGDVVRVPLIETRTEEGRNVEVRHRFRRRGIPAPCIRFVHGSRRRLARFDASLGFLNVSNYPSDKAGDDARQTFPGGFGYEAHAHADPDTFKIEVRDTAAGSDTLDVTLEALKPAYTANGSIDPETVTYAPFEHTDANADKRNIAVKCQRLAGASRTRFRSRYLRLVVDDEDFAVLSGNPKKTDGTAQGLLTSDLADGAGGANDHLEILDQKIRASYELSGCPAPEGQQKCRTVCELAFAQGIRKRIRICVHAYRESVGGNNPFNISEQDIRLRTMKWFRRVYAQISMAPKFVPCREGGPDIEFLDPPPNDMITISNDHGNPVSSQGGPYQVRFRLGLVPDAVADAETDAVDAGLRAADARPTMTLDLPNGHTPRQVARAMEEHINHLDSNLFTAEAFENPRTFSATYPSCDVLIRRRDNRRLMIEILSVTEGAGMDFTVASINPTNIDGNLPRSWPVLNPELRRLIRGAPGTDDRIDIYICRDFDGFAGLGIIPNHTLGASYRHDAPVRWAYFVMAGNGHFNCMDGSDDAPWVNPHEAGHVLSDAIHIHDTDPLRDPCLMRGTVLSGVGVDASKRIFDFPVTVRTGSWDPDQSTPGAFRYTTGNMAEAFRTQGRSVLENWD